MLARPAGFRDPASAMKGEFYSIVSITKLFLAYTARETPIAVRERASTRIYENPHIRNCKLSLASGVGVGRDYYCSRGEQCRFRGSSVRSWPAEDWPCKLGIALMKRRSGNARSDYFASVGCRPLARQAIHRRLPRPPSATSSSDVSHESGSAAARRRLAYLRFG